MEVHPVHLTNAVRGIVRGNARGKVSPNLQERLHYYCSPHYDVVLVPTAPTSAFRQWRRQDLLRGGAKLEIMSWCTRGGLQGWCSSCSITNSLVTNAVAAVLIERAVSCWHLHRLISQTTQYLAVRFTPKWTKNEIVGSRGARAPVPHSWRCHCV